MRQFCLLEYQDPEVSVPLFDGAMSGGNPNVTIIIGPNGSGKSRVLSRVVDELCYLSVCREVGKTSVSTFRPTSDIARLKYRIDGAECEVRRKGSDLECTLNGDPCELFSLPFPKRVAAVSHLPTDRFRFIRAEASGFYRYLGLRQATNLTTTGALETKVIQSLLIGFTQPKFVKRLEKWLSLAGMSNNIGLDLVLDNDKLLTEDFDFFRESAWKIHSRRGGARNRSEEDRMITDLDKVWIFFGKLRELRWMGGKHPSCAYQLKYLISQPEDALIWIDGFDIARRWRLFRKSSLLLGKPGGNYPFSDLSSGEQQLIGTNARLLSELESDSLVVIDEPEVSLHPDWQIKYVPTLLESLEAMPATHIIIATHSHFMVSDLGRNNSALVTSSYDNGPKFKLFDGDVYGRSPENILYRVFGVATTGNSYVEGDLYSALRMLSNSDPTDFDELRNIYNRLDRVRGKDNAALNVILDQVRGVLEANRD